MNTLAVRLQFKRFLVGARKDAHPTDFYTRLVETDEGWFLVRHELPHDKKNRKDAAGYQPVIYALKAGEAAALRQAHEHELCPPDGYLPESAQMRLDEYINTFGRARGRCVEEMGATGPLLAAVRLRPDNAPGSVPPFSREAHDRFWWVKPSWYPSGRPWSVALASFYPAKGHYEHPFMRFFLLTPDGGNDNFIVRNPDDLLRERWGGPATPPAA